MFLSLVSKLEICTCCIMSRFWTFIYTELTCLSMLPCLLFIPCEYLILIPYSYARLYFILSLYHYFLVGDPFTVSLCPVLVLPPSISPDSFLCRESWLYSIILLECVCHVSVKWIDDQWMILDKFDTLRFTPVRGWLVNFRGVTVGIRALGSVSLRLKLC